MAAWSGRRILTGLFALAILAGGGFTLHRLSAQSGPIAPIEQSRAAGIAVSGHDPVAYFSEGRPVLGRNDITVQYQGAEWRFSSPGNRDRFRAQPERYAPQFGGYCSWAVSQGYTAPADPTAWAIRDGKLYLNYDHSIQRQWEQDAAGNIAKGNANWPGILGRK